MGCEVAIFGPDQGNRNISLNGVLATAVVWYRRPIETEVKAIASNDTLRVEVSANLGCSIEKVCVHLASVSLALQSTGSIVSLSRHTPFSLLGSQRACLIVCRNDANLGRGWWLIRQYASVKIGLVSETCPLAREIKIVILIQGLER